MALNIFLDSGLTTPLVGNFFASQDMDGSSDPVVFQFWVGDDESGYTYECESDPGVDPITISITDSAPGSGHEATEVKLATTEAGLASATAGAALDIGVTLTSGVGNAVEVWMEADDVTGVLATVTELGLTTPSLIKAAA